MLLWVEQTGNLTDVFKSMYSSKTSKQGDLKLSKLMMEFKVSATEVKKKERQTKQI